MINLDISYSSVEEMSGSYEDHFGAGNSDVMRSIIHWLFNGKCACCKQNGQEVNEIIPRSRGGVLAIRNWRNRVLLCRRCHNAYHEHGVTNERIVEMQEQRKGYLMMIGREAYV